MFKNVLVSVSNKENIADFLKSVTDKDSRIVSTGGTARHLSEQGFDVNQVSSQTGFPEVMDGRVKTLHPKVHMCLLAREGFEADEKVLKDHSLDAFDLVIVNLYPFEQDASIDMIDIGGPSMLRAAAKNHERIVTLCDPLDYQWVSERKEGLSREERRYLASKVFSHVSAYDSMISHWLDRDFSKQREWTVGGRKVSHLRYGENPHQQSVWLRSPSAGYGIHSADILQGKPLSYNNILDLDAAVTCLREFAEKPACVAVKHTNPCGIGEASSIKEAVRKALVADPKSVFGGILALNHPLDSESAEEMTKLFLECVIAPEVTSEAKKVLEKKKNLRVLTWPKLMKKPTHPNARTVVGGVLIQEVDQLPSQWDSEWMVFGKTPDESVKNDLFFAWRTCAHLKSNAIAITKSGQSLGLGMGQVNRVDAVEQSIKRWKEFHPNVSNPVLASDAFFPFADSIEVIAGAGIKHVIQPGGSIKDEEVKAAAERLGVTMVFTGRRHFKH